MRFGLRRDRGADDARWLVLDVESSGLDPRRDRLLAIAALAVRPSPERLRLSLGDSFEVVLRQSEATPDKPNILLHGIGVGAQRSGVEPAIALAAFIDFVGTAPLIGFHASFDRMLIDRTLRRVLERRLANRWLDLADLAPVLRPDSRAKALDDWLALYGIRVRHRHQAAADALASAELLQKLWPIARTQGADGSFAGLARIAAARRWLPS